MEAQTLEPDVPINEKENVHEWMRFGLKLAVQSALHPFEYSKVLIQVRRLHKFIFYSQITNYNHQKINSIISLITDRFRADFASQYNNFIR